MSELTITMKDIKSIIPYNKNPRKNNKAVKEVINSIKEYGFRQPIVVDEDMVIVVGHTRLLAAKQLKMSEVPVHIAKDLNEQQISAYRIADNKTNEFAEWDDALLIEELKTVGDLYTGFTGKEIDDLFKTNDENNYTQKIEAPIYKPMLDTAPPLEELYSQTKTNDLIVKINKSAIPEEIKVFLRMAAMRHTVFNYHNIAEYYCHASEDIQKMMEDSALVIIDFDDAIENGYVKFTEKIAKLVGKQKESEEEDLDNDE